VAELPWRRSLKLNLNAVWEELEAKREHDNAKLVDGEKVALRAVKEVKGGSHVGAMTGAIVATSIVFFPAAPLFLFIKGKDITIPKGTEITAYINGDIPLDPKKFQPLDAPKNGEYYLLHSTGASAETMVQTIELNRILTEPRSALMARYVGNTPTTTLHLSAGDHLIKFEKPGFKPWERTLTITPGETTTIPATREKLDVAPSQ